MVFCVNCGFNCGNAKFCAQCGTSCGPAKSTNAPAPAPTSAPAPPPRNQPANAPASRSVPFESVVGTSRHAPIQRDTPPPTKYQNPSNAHETEITVVDERLDISDPELRDALTQVRSPNGSINWFLMGYVPKTNRLTLVASGSEGPNEFEDELEHTKLLYGLVRVPVERIGDKLVMVTWIGSVVPATVKGLIGPHTTEINKWMGPTHMQLSATDESQLSAKAIRTAIDKLLVSK